MTLQQLLTIYWSQVTLVLLTIAYFIKRIFDDKSKKIEINYSLFQQNRINVVNTFFANYAKTESMWQTLSAYDVLSYNIDGPEADNIIWPPLNDLKQSVLELKIYFVTYDHKLFELLLVNFLSIQSNLGNLYSHKGEESALIQKVNNFNSFRDNIFIENNKIIDKLSEVIRKSFRHK